MEDLEKFKQLLIEVVAEAKEMQREMQKSSSPTSKETYARS